MDRRLKIHNPDDYFLAESLIASGKSLRKVSKELGIPASTLQNHIKGPYAGYNTTFGRERCLSLEEEDAVIKSALDLAKRGNPITKDELKALCRHELGKTGKLASYRINPTCGPSDKFIGRLLARHPELALGKKEPARVNVSQIVRRRSKAMSSVINGKIKVAIFGLGRAGRIHFENLIKSYRVHIAYIVEPDTDVATKYIHTFKMPKSILLKPSESNKVFEDNRVNAVFVTTPTFQHEEIVRKALENGKAVFCEKPIAETKEAVASLYDLAEASGNPLFCSFNRRFDPSIRSVHDRVNVDNTVGDIHMIKTCSRDAPLPPMSYLRISGGIFHDCCVHDIDMICWIMKEYPSSVYCTATAHIPEIKGMADFDTVAVVLRFPSNRLAMIDLSRYAAYGYDQRIEVFGNKSMLISENQSPGNVHHYTNDGVHRDPIDTTFKYRYADSYWEALMHFLDVVEGKAKLEITKESCLKVVEIATACEISNHLLKPVELPLTEEDYSDRPEICVH